MKKHKIQNLSDLKHEQSLLRMQLDTKEKELSESWTYLKVNYKRMVWHEINPFKDSSVLSTAVGWLQPGLLPVIAEVAKGTAKGSPINLKVVGSAAKYAIASLGIKWLRKWIDSRDAEEVVEPSDDSEDAAAEQPIG